nr:tetratricopeptide repeat protein [uncultured Mucilaginibacter sp.]
MGKKQISIFVLLFACCGVSMQTLYAQSLRVGARGEEDVEQMFYAALSKKTVEDNAGAANIFTKILEIDPDNDASLYELANIKKLQKNYPAALPLLEKAVTIKPDNTWYWLALADVYEKNNDFTKLENVFAQLIRLNPDKPDGYFDKANALFLQGKYDEALKVYDQVEKITGPSDDLTLNRQKVYLKQGDPDKAAASLEALIAASPNNIRYYLMLADLYNSVNQRDKTAKVLERAKKIDPNNGLIHLALADIYRDKKNVEGSFSELEQAFSVPELSIEQKIRIIAGYIPQFSDPNARASALALSKLLVTSHPEDARAHAIYGDILLQNDKVSEAKASYKKSIAINDQVYEVREQLVRIALGENDLATVIKEGEEALSFFPNQATMNYFVGMAWLQKKDAKKALTYLKNAVSLELEDKELLSQSYSALGDCYHELQNNKLSDENYDKSLQYNADNVYTLNNYAYYLAIRGENLVKAAAMAKRAVDAKPDMGSFEDTYAWVLFKQKKYAEAKTWMEKAMLHNKDKSATQAEHYGDILFNTGNADAALQSWIKAKEYGGKSAVLERKINEKKYSE